MYKLQNFNFRIMSAREIRGHNVIYYYDISRFVDLSINGMYIGEYKFTISYFYFELIVEKI